MTNRVLLFMALIIGGCTGGQDQQEQNQLSAEAFMEKINATENAVVVDVRTPEEFEKGHLENAVNIDWKGDDFDARLSELDRSTPVFVYCLSGGRSSAAVGRMQELGFENIVEMPGGMMEWRAKNLPETASGGEATGMSMDAYEAQLRSDKLVLVDFYADWCEPCKRMEPYLKEIAADMSDKVKLIRIDADENPQLCKALGVSALPVLKLYENGELRWEHKGYIDERPVRDQLTAVR